ncbi:MAG: hypothetical protein DRN14_00145 [Thermoplasmata archaeon]|nr:MAG: hypothetical protein DRN14_00145 [Thermoplasmata archaeon]
MSVELLMMDSGAFSVWTKGSEVDLDAYIEFCKDHLDVIDVIVALDVIPGRPGDKASLTRENIETSCELGWKNYQRMLKAGLPVEKVLPVFHQNDDFKWLRRFIRRGVPYFGISPANDRTSYQRQLWLDQCMRIVCDDKGMPKAKFHGFAVTSVPLMLRYPWYSCDSASWLRCAMYGGVMIPWTEPDGERNYLKTPRVVNFSTKNDLRKEKGAHYDSMNAAHKKQVDKYLKDMGVVIGKSSYRREERKYKVSARGEENIFCRHEDHVIVEKIEVAGVSNSVAVRAVVNMRYMEEVEKRIEWPRPFKSMKRGLI